MPRHPKPLQGHWPALESINQTEVVSRRLVHRIVRDSMAIMWDAWDIAGNSVYFKFYGNPQMFVPNDDDRRYFLENLIFGGSLNLELRFPGSKNWTDFQIDMFRTIQELFEDVKFSQTKKRKSGLIMPMENRVSLRVPHS